MTKFEKLVDMTRNAITSRLNENLRAGYYYTVQMAPIQLTTKELKAVLLEHGEYIKITASGAVWTCFILKKSLGCGVHSVWIKADVRKIW